jgi:ribonuclease P protein component
LAAARSLLPGVRVAASVCLPDRAEASGSTSSRVRLKRRPEFLATARGVRTAASTIVLQAARRPGDPPVTGIGFTVTRKIGGAVVRNRARRRLREAVRTLPPEAFASGWNYVVVARAAALTCPFPQLHSDLMACLRRLPQGPGVRAS